MSLLISMRGRLVAVTTGLPNTICHATRSLADGSGSPGTPPLEAIPGGSKLLVTADSVLQRCASRGRSLCRLPSIAEALPRWHICTPRAPHTMAAAAARQHSSLSFTGKQQPAASRLSGTEVWAATTVRPGPGQYPLAGSIGTQAESKRASAPGVSFPRAPREHVGLRTASPGPKFGATSSMGRQHVSKRPSAPMSSFGTSTRDKAALLYSIASARVR